jgi:hypothetical protein
MIRSVLIVLLLQFNFLSLGQKPQIPGVIRNAEFSILYRGYNNRMEIFTCQGCDSVFVTSPDAIITMQEKGMFTVNPKIRMRTLTLTVQCV